MTSTHSPIVPTLAAFAPRYVRDHALANGEKPSSVEHKRFILRAHLVPLLGEVPLDQIHTEQVQALKAELLGRGLAAKTVNSTLSVLRTLLRDAVEWGLLPAMPCKLRQVRTCAPEVAFYREEDYQRLIEGAARLGLGQQAMVLLGGEAGLRLGEMLALRFLDVDLERGLLYVRRSEWRGHTSSPKSRKGRVVPMTARLSGVLRSLRERAQDEQQRVLLRKEGDAPSQQTLRSWMGAAQKAAGLPRTCRLHLLRHTFCSRLAARNAPVRAIQELAGHQSLKMTERYLHLSDTFLARAIDLLEPGAPAIPKA